VILAALVQVDKHYGEQTVLAGANLELRPGERLALVGRNGSGKTTVLRLLSGSEAADGGEVLRRAELTWGLLDQEARLGATEPTATIADVADAAFADLDAMESELQGLEAAGLDDGGRYAAWEDLHERFTRRGGYARRARRDAVLHALGFQGRAATQLEHLSGGERTRLGLARLLMAQPDILLLDEPTNHLDLEMRSWLASFLARYPGAAVVVSHDRDFLDGACDRTAEVDRGELRVAHGNPTEYREARIEQMRIEARTRANQRREHDRLEQAALRMKRWAGQNEKLHRRARAMERRVERYEAEMLDDARPDAATTRFRFSAAACADTVLDVAHLSARYREPLFADVAAIVRRGERVVITGPNGAGKTTLLRTLLGERPSDDPRAAVRWGARVRVAYYDQRLGGLDPENTLIDELIRMVGEREAHNLLGRFLFPYQAQFKRVGQLSGGERARLALLKLTLGEANVLVLDEPTNHLDVEMIEALEGALGDFEGTLLLVSHDRRFVERLATRVWRVAGGEFRDYPGDWSYYERKRREDIEAASIPEPAATPAPLRASAPGPAAAARRSRWQLQRDLERLEGEIVAQERELQEIRLALGAAAPTTDPGQWAALGRRHDQLEGELLVAIAEWEAISDALLAAGAG
jgi:ATP-binding cassette, subfamily F, member 3